MERHLLLDLCAKAPASAVTQKLLYALQPAGPMSANPSPRAIQQGKLDASSCVPTTRQPVTDLRHKQVLQNLSSDLAPPTSYGNKSPGLTSYPLQPQSTVPLTIPAKPIGTSNPQIPSSGATQLDGVLGAAPLLSLPSKAQDSQAKAAAANGPTHNKTNVGHHAIPLH
jgi:hypothetical protein